MRSALLIALFSMPVIAAEGWEELLVQGDKGPWKKVDKGWIYAKDAKLESKAKKLLEAVEAEKGNVWINGEKGRLPDLITKREDYKDVEVHVEFMLGTNSNAGIKFHAVYEIQLLDMTNKKGDLTGDSMGGIYPRAEYNPKYTHIDKGVPPKVNAAKPAGEWQTLDVTFRSPRFNDKGEKTENAKVMKAVLNGQVIHENQDFKTPTGANYKKKEEATGPFMLQCDHGPTAWRNVKIREVK